jgi:hypothetical protein
MELREENCDWSAESKRNQRQYPLHLLKLRQSLVAADGVLAPGLAAKGTRKPHSPGRDDGRRTTGNQPWRPCVA